ncbi:hypothetical protein CLU79DRAFT_397156 [Phycomyces nitens]|nr:hypothetical protein CLU79DRAFT_397156 [Phycomyces nitens]
MDGHPQSPQPSPIMQQSLIDLALQDYEKDHIGRLVYQDQSLQQARIPLSSIESEASSNRVFSESNGLSSHSSLFGSALSTGDPEAHGHQDLLIELAMARQQLSIDDQEDLNHSKNEDEEEDDDEERRGYRREDWLDNITERSTSTLHQWNVWEEYEPEYRMLRESLEAMKQSIYKDIQNTLNEIETLDKNFEVTKAEFHEKMEDAYTNMAFVLLERRDRLLKQKMKFSKEAQTDTQGRQKIKLIVIDRLLFVETIRFHSEKVRLNVGGGIFETSLGTLRRDQDSLLATMFSGKHVLTPGADGSYFLDRDPSHFRLVLNYLRDLRIPPTILQDKAIRQELLQEAKYYQIQGLINLLV